LIPRGTQQEAAAATFVERTAKFFPRSFKLRAGAHVAKFIEPRKFQ
jgi:hypothetical protein